MLNSTAVNNDSIILSNCKQTQRIIYYLNTIVPLLWVIIGTITNSLSLVVFSRRTMRRNSTFIYLAIMSFSDIVTIWTSSFRDYLAYKFNVYINGDVPCKLHTFLFFVFAQFSSWLLVGANLDRLVCVISLNKYSKIWCTRQTATKFAIVLFVILLLLNSHFLAFIESKAISEFNSNHTSLSEIVTVHPYVYPKCTLKNFSTYIIFYSNIYTWIDACMYCLLPFIIMLICNITLIKRVFTTKRNLFLKQQSNSASSKRYSIISLFKPKKSSQAGTAAAAAATSATNRYKKKMSYNMSTTTTNTTGYSYTPYVMTQAANNADSSMERMRNMAITIIGVTILFIIFTVPINIYIPITLAYSSSSKSSSNSTTAVANTTTTTTGVGGEECQDILFSILNNMVNANHSINFFIYYMTNSKFNKELKILLETLKKSLHIQTGRRDGLSLFQSFTTTFTTHHNHQHNNNTTTTLNTVFGNTASTASKQKPSLNNQTSHLSHKNSTKQMRSSTSSGLTSPIDHNNNNNIIQSADV